MKKIKSIIVLVLVGGAATAAALPPNDNFADHETISGPSGTASGSNMGATLEDGEPKYGNSNTVWWTWTPTTSGPCAIDTFGSTFDTYLAVFTGNTVSSLSYVAANNNTGSVVQSLVCFDAMWGETYRIQISGYHPGDDGFITLNWKPVTWSEWILDYISTNMKFYTIFADDLSVLSYKKVIIYDYYYRTNETGCMEWKTESSQYCPDGITIHNKKNEKKVDGKQLDGGGTQSDKNVCDYNGKSVLAYDNNSKTLTVYKVKKGAFTKVGEQAVEHYSSAYFSGSEIYVRVFDKPAGVSCQGLKVFDKNLKKQKWSEPLAPGFIEVVGKGLVGRKVTDLPARIATITYRKKGKKNISQHTINLTTGVTWYIRYDPRGGVLYWTVNSASNSPITYLDRKGKKLVDNGVMPEVGDNWSCESFDGKSLYVKKFVSPGIFTFYLYKVKNLKKLGEETVTVPHTGLAWLKAGKKTFIYSRYNDTSWKYGVAVYDKKLKKEKWSDPPDEGSIEKIVKDTFVRSSSETVGNTTTWTYKLFNKKGEIVTYVLSYMK